MLKKKKILKKRRSGIICHSQRFYIVMLAHVWTFLSQLNILVNSLSPLV